MTVGRHLLHLLSSKCANNCVTFTIVWWFALSQAICQVIVLSLCKFHWSNGSLCLLINCIAPSPRVTCHQRKTKFDLLSEAKRTRGLEINRASARADESINLFPMDSLGVVSMMVVGVGHHWSRGANLGKDQDEYWQNLWLGFSTTFQS